jgi:hypothetical protein
MKHFHFLVYLTATSENQYIIAAKKLKYLSGGNELKKITVPQS